MVMPSAADLAELAVEWGVAPYPDTDPTIVRPHVSRQSAEWAVSDVAGEHQIAGGVVVRRFVSTWQPIDPRDYWTQVPPEKARAAYARDFLDRRRDKSIDPED